MCGVQAGIVMVPPSVVLNDWHTTTGTMEKDVRLFTQKLHQKMLSGVQVKAELLSPLHSSTTNLARILSSHVNETQLSIPNIFFFCQVIPNIESEVQGQIASAVLS